MVLFTGSLFYDNIFVRGQGGMKMDEIWKKAVIAAMEKKGYTREQLAAEMEISVKELNRILSGDCRISLEQLSEFTNLLEMDMNKVLGIEYEEEHELLLSDELEIKINEIARAIPKGNRSNFLRALIYLSGCFYNNKNG